MYRRFLKFERLYVSHFNAEVVVDPVKDTTKSGAGGGDDIQALRDKLAGLEKEKAAWESSKDVTLNDKVRREREDREKKDSSNKGLEAALTFNLMSKEFLKANESVLPKEISEIFQVAERENYASALEKANATKAAIIQSFFTQQFNVDLLTDTQKVSLVDYLKLTKTAKEEKAKDIYENLFEPALLTLKRVRKAEELGRNKMGFKDGSKDSQYKEKLMSLSKKHFLGEK